MSKKLKKIAKYYDEGDLQEDKVDLLVNSSVKTQMLFRLLRQLKSEGHRVLVFSMSKKMLDLLEFIIQHKEEYIQDFSYIRIDGDTEISSREGLCQQFNQDPNLFLGLLTTKVGGFGLNLIGADRAVILDPDWNPANDNQAVDRCYRIGQSRDVIVYRLVSCGGIEELIYRRQMHKKGMNLQTIEDDDKTGNQEQSDERAFQKYFNDKDLF
jgi:DNA excision repair protein ERCC-6